MIKYPNGLKIEKKTVKSTHKNNLIKAGNRGMGLENDINLSNEYYKNKGLCLINKRPTPINVVKVDYSKGARIIDAYFEKKSTTDYNGVYKGRYIDLEAKSTHSKTSLPNSNIPAQQIEHLNAVIKQGGIALFIIEFVPLKEIYLIDAYDIINYESGNKRRSIPYAFIKEKGHLLKQGINPRIDYLSVIDKLYFLDK